MTRDFAQHLSKITPDLAVEQVEKLKTLFPECVTEGPSRLRPATRHVGRS